MTEASLVEKMEALKTGIKSEYQKGWDHGLSEAISMIRQHQAAAPMDLTTPAGIKRVMGNDMPLITDRVDIEWIKRLRIKTGCDLRAAKHAWDLLAIPAASLTEKEKREATEAINCAIWPEAEWEGDPRAAYAAADKALSALLDRYELRRRR